MKVIKSVLIKNQRKLYIYIFIIYTLYRAITKGKPRDLQYKNDLVNKIRRTASAEK